MNGIAEQIKKVIDSKIKVKNENDKEGGKIFSWPSFFTGEEYNQELTKSSKISQSNIIDFEKEENRKKELVENKIKEIVNSSTNKKLIEQKDFPVIWFKNIDKIENKSPLQKSLLAVFDPAQNYSLSIKGEIIDLSQFVLIVTSSTHDTGKLSNPLMSRLDCINVETARPKEFFWDKYFYHILIAGLLVFLTLILLLIYCSDRKDTKTEE